MDQEQLDLWLRFANRRNSRRRLARAAGGGLAALLAAQVPSSATWAQESTPCPTTTAEEAKAIAEAYFAAFNAGDADALGALLAPDYRHHGALVSEQDRALHQERLRTQPGGVSGRSVRTCRHLRSGRSRRHPEHLHRYLPGAVRGSGASGSTRCRARCSHPPGCLRADRGDLELRSDSELNVRGQVFAAGDIGRVHAGAILQRIAIHRSTSRSGRGRAPGATRRGARAGHSQRCYPVRGRFP